MFESVGARSRRAMVGVLAAATCALSVFAGNASAQTPIVLNQPGSQVTDTTIRGGSYANTNFDDDVLVTRKANDLVWERRTILKFDTERTIAKGKSIASATLTLTVKSGLGATLRSLQAYRIPQSFQEAQATWTIRQGTYKWAQTGCGMATEQYSSALAPAAPGSKVVFDVTSLVQRTINGEFDSRYTRILLKDAGADAKESYREFYPSEDPNPANRPTLTVVLGTPTTTPAPAPVPPPPPPPAPEPTPVVPPPPPPGPGPVTFKMLQWNIAQGWGTDGKSNIDRVVAFIVQQRPDVISFNEINNNSSTNNHVQIIADKLKAQTGQTWTYHWIQKTGLARGEGEAVMTRFAVDAVDDFLLSVSRSVAMLRVNLNGRNLSLFSTHLDHQSSATRVTQVKQLVAWAASQPENRIVAGDFNGWPGTNEHKEMLKTYNDSWIVAKAAGTAVTFAGNPDGNTRNTRIDYIFQSKGTTGVTVVGAQVFDLRNASGVRPSDHNPLIVTFRVD